MSRIFEITEKVSHYASKADIELLNRAYVFAAQAHADQRRSSGEMYITHPLAVADILASLKMDVATVATGLLHDTVEDTHISLEDIQDRFGEEIAMLVDGVTKIGKMHFDSSEHKQAENFRKMILATAKDLRVLLVKLADRTHNMRTLGFVSQEKARRVAKETLQIHAPLAHRLGIHWMKQEMEDIAFSYLDPEAYEQVKVKLQDKLDFLQHTQHNLEGLLHEALSREGLDAKVQGRMKHLYSLHQKMQRKHIDFEEIYDIVAFRLIVKDAASCYHALGMIHSLYPPVPGRFKDYIALPKPNGYQSLHTSVIGPENHRIEVQIRAESMHQHAEDGVAAHWLYKEAGGSSSQREMLWLSQLIELLQEADNPNELMENVRLDLFVQEVYVFSRDGDIYPLPRGARPLDFAYAVHTDVGNHTIGVRINGEMKDFRTKLHNGDQIEILTSADQEPSWQWLKYVITPKARQSIRQYYRRQEQETSIQIGIGILNDLLSSDPPEEILQALQCDKLESLQEKIGKGEISLDMLLKQFSSDQGAQLKMKCAHGTYMYAAHCCCPIPGDAVSGRMIAGKGIEVHYRGCQALSSAHQYRWFDVEEWKANVDAFYFTGIEVKAENRRGMLSILTGHIAEAGSNIDDVILDQRPGEMTVLRMLVSVHDRKHLADVLKVLKAVDGVVTVKRQNKVGLGENHDDLDKGSAQGIADRVREIFAKGRRSFFKVKDKQRK